MGAATILCECLKANALSPRVAAQVTAAVWSLANHPSNKAPVLQSGVVDVIVSAMRASPASIEVSIACCAALASIGNAGGGAKAALMRAGAAAAVMEAMTLHAQSRGVAVHGSTALWTMAISKANKLVLVEAMAHDTLLATLRAHEADAAVVEKAVGALHSLSATPETAQSMMSDDLVACVVNALREHMERPEVAEHACGTLGNVRRAVPPAGVLTPLSRSWPPTRKTRLCLAAWAFQSWPLPCRGWCVRTSRQKGDLRARGAGRTKHKDNAESTAEADRLLDLLWSESVVV